MIDPSPFDTEAFAHASDLAGEYLELIKKTDLVTLSRDEWMTFVVVMCTGFADSRYRGDRRLEADLTHHRAWEAPTEPPF